MREQAWHYGDRFPVSVLALCLRDPHFLTSNLDVIKASYFGKHDLICLASIVMDYHSRYEEIPDRSAVEAEVHKYSIAADPSGELKTRASLLGWVDHIYSKVMTDSDSAFVTEKIIEFGRRQAVRIATSQVVDLLEGSDEISLERVAAIWDRAMLVGAARDLGVDFNVIAEDLPAILQEDPLYGRASKVPTGVIEIDSALMGGLGAGQLGVVAGPPNRGKSTVLSILGANAARHFRAQSLSTGVVKSVVHITCEMNQIDISLKYASCVTGLGMDDVISGDPSYSRAVRKALEGMGPVAIKFFPPGTASIDDVKSYISTKVIRDKLIPGLIVVDYADRFKGGEDDRFRYMGVVYDKLIALGSKFCCPVWTGSQITRAKAHSEVIDDDGLAESWKKVEAADFIITLCQTEDEYHKGLMRLYCPKVRRGKARLLVPCRMDMSRVSMRELTEDEKISAGFIKSDSDEFSSAPPSPDELFSREAPMEDVPLAPPANVLEAMNRGNGVSGGGNGAHTVVGLAQAGRL